MGSTQVPTAEPRPNPEVGCTPARAVDSQPGPGGGLSTRPGGALNVERQQLPVEPATDGCPHSTFASDWSEQHRRQVGQGAQTRPISGRDDDRGGTRPGESTVPDVAETKIKIRSRGLSVRADQELRETEDALISFIEAQEKRDRLYVKSREELKERFQFGRMGGVA